MKKIMFFCLFAGFVHSAFAMPCDAGYECVSKTGKYKISLQRCRYRNNIHLFSTRVNNVEIADATLNKGWDGDRVLAFEINLPTTVEGAVKILTAEVPANHKLGIIRMKYALTEPGPLKVINSERISCEAVD